ncbi:MAG: universal stress protein [Thermodesulfobacteriota bacterium]|nr:MAG: universal stress protein [Thermodesulfobacteriota bacterium]
MKKIVWATDGSEEAERALEYAKYLALKSDSEIIGVHVVPLAVQLLYENLSESKKDVKDWRLQIEKNAAIQFEEISTGLKKAGIKFDGVILKGKPSDKIREIAKRRKADLIVLGKHGHGFFESMLVGSETIKVLKGSHIPVLAVKDNKKTKAQFKKILVPIDLTHCSDTAVFYALNLAQLTGAVVKVVHVLRLDMYAQDLPASALEIVIEQTEKALKKRVLKIKKDFENKNRSSDNVKITNEVIHGMSEAVTISNYSEKNNIDLLVIHTHGRTGITRFLLGSVTERVISRSKCSVLAIRPE